MKSFWTAFLLIFIAELGDKTQFMTLALSSRYRATIVLLGVVLGKTLPHGPMNIGAGIIFIVFALLSLKEGMKADQVEEEADKDIAKTINNPRHLWLTIASTFFIAELADKTMLATVAIASRDKNYFAVWLGSTLGLVASNCLAIVVGKALSKKLSGKVMHMTSAAIFVLAGFLSIWQGVTQK